MIAHAFIWFVVLLLVLVREPVKATVLAIFYFLFLIILS